MDDDVFLKQVDFLERSMACKGTLESLNLNNRNLNFLSGKIRELRDSLKTLSLAGNNLKQLPTEIIDLQKLTYLNLSHNNFSRFPKEILELENLEYLGLSSNYLQFIPKGVGVLKKLNHLDLEFNCLNGESLNHLKQIHENGISVFVRSYYTSAFD